MNRQPLRTPNWPNTPLGLLDAGHFPSRHLALLVGTLLFLGLAWFVVGRLRDRWPAATAVHRWVLVALLAAVIILADLWLLYWA